MDVDQHRGVIREVGQLVDVQEMSLLPVRQIGDVPEDVEVAEVLLLLGQPFRVPALKDVPPEQNTKFRHGSPPF